MRKHKVVDYNKLYLVTLFKKDMKKRGQLEISFSMIFSIIIIIAIIGVAIYVITFFLGIDKCGEAGFFYSDLQNEINKAWKSQSYKNNFEVKLPSDIKHVCFGELNENAKDSKSQEIKEKIELSIYASDTANVFLSPSEEACDGDLANNKIENVNIDGFYCLENRNKLKLNLEKNIKDSLVKLTEED